MNWVNWDYVAISALWFMEFAIWGAWLPVLAVRLLGPLKMSGKQTGWIYATFPLACIFAPLASGYLADSVLSAERVIVVTHAIGAVLLFIAARQTKFWGMFWTMFAYSICFTATLPLLNNVVYAHVPHLAAWVFLWAPVSWALIGYFLTGFRHWRKLGGDGPDFLYLAAILSVVMVLVALVQPATAPQNKGNPMMEAVAMLRNFNYLIFIILQMIVAGMMQFYFLATGRFMQDKAISGSNVSAAMGLAQAVQAATTILLLEKLISTAGYHWTFAIGALCWTALFATYLASPSRLWIVLVQSFHGLAYAFFMIGGIMFVGAMAPQSIGASAQSLLNIATNGIGLFLGTQLAGRVMERNSAGGKFQWSKIWTVPLGITLAGAIVFAVVFKAPNPAEFQEDVPRPEKTVAMAPANT